jgi:peptide/nickel transport system permease protein
MRFWIQEFVTIEWYEDMKKRQKQKKSLPTKNIITWISAIILLAIIIATITAPLWISQSPFEMAPKQRLLPPSSEHWFGTDNFGRDLFARTVYGARVSLIVGFFTAIITTVIGSVIGLFTGYYKILDSIIMRIVDGMMAFPPILLSIALVAAMGGSVPNIIIALVLTSIPSMVRIVRASTMQVKRMQYIEAAKASGSKDISILFKHIYPNVITPIIVQATFLFANAILVEAALSFLGVGVQPPTPTWGNILGDSKSFLTLAPWFSVCPGIAIVLSVLSLNLLGDSLRDYMDPRSSNRHLRKVKKSNVEKGEANA